MKSPIERTKTKKMIIIDLNNLDSSLLESVKSNDLHRHFNIGAIMKNRRFEKNLTLQELCKGICCVAYQSRLERNQYDSLNEIIIPKLCERLDLDYEEMKIGTSTVELEYALHDYMLGNRKELVKRFEKCKENDYFSTNNLIGCMVYLSDKKYAQFNEYIKRIPNSKYSAYKMIENLALSNSTLGEQPSKTNSVLSIASSITFLLIFEITHS